MNCLNCGAALVESDVPDDWNAPKHVHCPDCFDGAPDASAVAQIVGRGVSFEAARVDWAGQYAEATS